MRILKAFAKIVVAILILNLVAFSVMHVLTHGKMFGSASGIILDFASFPRIMKDAFKQITSPVRNHQLPIDPSFEAVNALDQDVFTLESHYSKDASALELELVNLRTNDVVHQWKYAKEHRNIDGVVSNHPVLLEDYSIIFNLERTVYKLDSNSNLVWKNDTWDFHHTIEVDHEGYLWIPATRDNGELDVNSELVNFGNKLEFRDNAVTRVDPATGKVVYSKSVAEMLLENNYPGLVYGFWTYDVIHLNDVQPVLEDSRFWKRGDLFLSCRNLHTVFLYRPSTGKIRWLRTGLWVSQHDVDVVDSTHITVFDNNVNTNFYDQLYRTNRGGDPNAMKTVLPPVALNAMVQYDFATDSLVDIAPEFCSREKIGTQSQGILTRLSTGLYFIEETDQGKIFIGDNTKTVYKKQFVSPDSTFVYYPGWTRIYEKIPVKR